jgi:molecular chaperone GrpE (heat shock protein)
MPVTEAPRVAKWPFLLGDLLLVALGVFVIFTASWPLSRWEVWPVAACFIAGAWLAIIPFVREHNAAVKLWEQANLAEAAQQIEHLTTVANQIAAATGQWQSVQETANKTVAAAAELTNRMTSESRAFSEFLQRSNDQEKQTLRLEVEKLRRNEGDFLQIKVHLLDHIYALFGAAVRSGQQGVIQQVGQLRAACFDTVRRIGLVAHEARPGDDFDPRAHQTPDGKEPEPGTKIAGTLACGYTYQGQPLRRILVALQKAGVAAVAGAEDAPTVPEIESELPLEPGQPS